MNMSIFIDIYESSDEGCNGSEDSEESVGKRRLSRTMISMWMVRRMTWGASRRTWRDA